MWPFDAKFESQEAFSQYFLSHSAFLLRVTDYDDRLGKMHRYMAHLCQVLGKVYPKLIRREMSKKCTRKKNSKTYKTGK